MPELAALIPDIGISSWLLVAAGALVVGFSKTALPGAGTIAVGLFALAMPAKESTAALLLLLIVGDLTALWVYRREPDIRMLVRLIPSVMVGVVVGTIFFATVGGDVVRGTIGVILLALVAVTVWRRRSAERAKQVPPARRQGAEVDGQDVQGRDDARGGEDARAPAGNTGADVAGAGTEAATERVRTGRGATVGPARTGGLRMWAGRAIYGFLGGFTTMVANAGGPVMTMYFYSMRLPVLTFLGTAAWFFAIVNILKLPFSASLGLFSRDTFVMDAMLVPVVLLGALIGATVAKRVSQGVFEKAVLVLTVASALGLLVI